MKSYTKPMLYRYGIAQREFVSDFIDFTGDYVGYNSEFVTSFDMTSF